MARKHLYDVDESEPRLKRSEVTLTDKDTASLVVFAIGVILVTLWASLKTKQGMGGFYLANRSLHFVQMACAMFLTNIGSAHLVGIAGSASRDGITVYAYELNATAILVILGWVFLPVYIVSGSLTTVDYLKKRYGGLRMEIYLAVLTLILTISTKTSVELYAVYKLLAMLFAEMHWLTACLPTLIWSVLMAIGGGLHSIASTHTLQAVYVLLGASALSYYSISTFDNQELLREKYFEAWPNTTRVHFGEKNASYPYTLCGIPRASSWNMIRSYNNHDLPWPGMVFGITVSALWYWCCDQSIVQVGLGARSIVHAKYACIMTGYMKILTFFFLVLPGIVARVLYTDHVACADPGVCERLCGEPSGCSNLAFPYIFMDVVPPGARGLVLGAILACCMTTLTSSLYSAATIFTVNIYRNMRAAASEMELLVITKLSIVCLGVLSLAWVPVVDSKQALFHYIQEITSTLAPPIAAVFLCGIFWERATESVLVLGLLMGAIRMVWSFSYASVPCGDDVTSTVPDIVAQFHYLHFGIFLFVLSVSYIVAMGIFSEPINIVHLYRLLYWLRHSKLDRVDIAELNTAYKDLLKKRKRTKEGKEVSVDEEFHTRNFKLNRLTLALCCVEPRTAKHLMTDDELRETTKQRTSITEQPRQTKVLDLHAVILLVVSAVIWGFFA